MFELAIVIGVVAVLVFTSAALFAASWITLLVAGGVVIGLGLLLGVPTGLVYHLRLRRALLHRGALPADWLLRPTRYHALLATDEKPAVLRAFYAGATGFALVMIGCLITTIGALR